MDAATCGFNLGGGINVITGMVGCNFVAVNWTRDTISQLKQQQQKLQQQKNKFEQQVINNKPQPASVEKLETLKLLLVNKTTLYKRLTQENSVYTSGFSSAMTELSKYHHRAISLHTIQMDANRVLFSGVARDPEAVPIWLTSFEQSTFLSGYLFTQFSMSENDHKQTTFVVSTDMGAE